MTRAAALLLLMALGSCSGESDNGGLSGSEARELDEAAAAIDINATLQPGNSE